MDRIVLEAKVQDWGNKCSEYAEKNGEENPDYLFEYGKALFAVAKLNSSLVDSQKMKEKQLPLENPKVKVVNLEEAGDEEIEEDEGESEPQVDAGDEKESEDKDNEQEDESEDEDDFVSAFQVVDVARVLFEKRLSASNNEDETKDIMTKLAKTRELLGDISLEDDNAPQAVEDYTEATQLKRKIYGEDSGEVSEAEFMLSLAYDATSNPSESVKHLKLAAAAAHAAKLPSANDLSQRAADAEQDLKASTVEDKQQAKEVTKESISGRKAIANAVQSMISNANDISQLARKRKRDDSFSGPKPTPPPPSKKPERG